VSRAYPALRLLSKLTRRQVPTVYSYQEVLPRLVEATRPDYQEYPCVIPNWDNTPRSGVNGLVLHGSTPELFRELLRVAVRRVASEPESRRIIFLKAWNEWAEGNYVEPDLKFGRAYLEALRDEVVVG